MAGIVELESEIARLRAVVRLYQESTSWRLTAPLRAMALTLRRAPPAPCNPAAAVRSVPAPAAAERVPLDPGAGNPSPAGPAVATFSDAQRASGAYWDGVVAGAADILPRTAWWNDPPTLRHINRVVCGERIDGAHAGFNRRLGTLLRGREITEPRAISVGSGSGGKELEVLRAGVVASFDCYDVGAGAVEQGRRMAAEQGFGDRLRFHHADAFAGDAPKDFDVVYWNNALHHMPDTAAAVAWSRDHLRSGGVFAMDDFVGASRFQHTPELMAWANRMLALLPDRLLRGSRDPTRTVPRVATLLDPDAVAAIDPTEAVDSGNILPAVRRVFPSADIIPTGGALYFVGLNDAFHNFVAQEDLRLLDALLLLDEAVAQRGETPYAVALAVKE
jgi:SAM-dependent methyltransferase